MLLSHKFKEQISNNTKIINVLSKIILKNGFEKQESNKPLKFSHPCGH